MIEHRVLILALMIMANVVIFGCTAECRFCRRPILRWQRRVCKTCRPIRDYLEGISAKVIFRR
jgi:hypothetical protein